MENVLLNERRKFEKGEISKPEFIVNMGKLHDRLFDYSHLLRDGLIGQLIIEAERVVAVSRRSGIKLVCDPGDSRAVPLEMLNFGSFEDKELVAVFAAIEKNIPESFTAFDVGGNIGWYALELAKRFPKAKIYSFEPIKETYNKMLVNLDLNLVSNVFPNNFGFSNETKILEFFYDKNQSGATSSRNIMDKTNVERVACSVKRLDEVSDKITDKIDFIKCDVEGAELFVFQGGIQTIKKHRPIIFCEMLRKWAAKFDYHPNEIVSLLGSLGYQCFAVDNDGSLFRLASVTDETVQTNFLFLHEAKHQLQ